MFKKNELLKNRAYYLMALPAMIIFFLFAYLPMPGIIVAFKDFNFSDGLFRSPWNGLKNFRFYFTSSDFLRTTFNTVWLNLNNIFWGTLLAVIFALLLNEIRNKSLKRLFQSLMFIPYFFSFVIVSKFILLIFSIDHGLINNIIRALGGEAVKWYMLPDVWRPILIATSVWKNVGYTVIIYLATISGIDEQLFEAAELDGAKRLQQIRHILIPHLIPVISMLTLLAIGKIFNGDFGLVYAVIADNGQLYDKTDIIETYLYRALFNNGGDFGSLAAVGLYQSVVGFIFVMGSNLIARKIDPDYSLF